MNKIQKIKIFLASSGELTEERKEIALLIAQENNKRIDENIFLELVVWEELLHSFTGKRIQDYFNRVMLKCEIVIVLFFKRIGYFTKEEFDLAYKNLCKNNMPQYLFVYLKKGKIDIDDIDSEELKKRKELIKAIEDMEEIYGTYSSIDELKLKLKRQLDMAIPEIKCKKQLIPAAQPEKPEVTKSENVVLFGYFFVEKDGLEEILIHDEADFPIVTAINVNRDLTPGFINEKVMDEIKKLGITKYSIPQAGYAKPVYYRLYQTFHRERMTKILPYIFFKIGLQNKFEGSGEFWRKCRWTSADTGKNKKSKFDIARYWRDVDAYYSKKLPIDISIDTPGIFKAINDEMYYEELGFKVLECVDSLIFTKDEKNELRFLMIRRKKQGECWEYPKGGLFYHETVLESAYREIEEETGIEIDNLILCGNLGWQTVNVEERKDFYDTLRVHGVTFYYTGDMSKIKLDPKHDAYKWESLDDARDMVWMKNYGPEFFNRWERNKKEILQKIAGIAKKEEIK